MTTKQRYVLCSGLGTLLLFTVACSTLAEAIQTFTLPIEITNISSTTIAVGQRVTVTGYLGAYAVDPDPGVTLPADELIQYVLMDGRGNSATLIPTSGLKIPKNLVGKSVTVTGKVKSVSINAGYTSKHLVIEVDTIHRSVQSNHDDATPDRRFD